MAARKKTAERDTDAYMKTKSTTTTKKKKGKEKKPKK